MYEHLQTIWRGPTVPDNHHAQAGTPEALAPAIRDPPTTSLPTRQEPQQERLMHNRRIASLLMDDIQLSERQGLPVSIQQYTLAVVTLVRAQQMELASAQLAKAQAIASDPSVQHDAAALKSLVAACDACKDAPGALRWLGVMRSRGFPRMASLYAAMHACAVQPGYWREALRLLDDLRTLRASYGGDVSQTRALAYCARACAASGETAKVLELLEKITAAAAAAQDGSADAKPPPATRSTAVYIAVMIAAKNAQQWDVVLAVWRYLGRKGVAPYKIGAPIAHEALAHVAARADAARDSGAAADARQPSHASDVATEAAAAAAADAAAAAALLPQQQQRRRQEEERPQAAALPLPRRRRPHSSARPQRHERALCALAAAGVARRDWRAVEELLRIMQRTRMEPSAKFLAALLPLAQDDDSGGGGGGGDARARGDSSSASDGGGGGGGGGGEQALSAADAEAAAHIARWLRAARAPGATAAAAPDALAAAVEHLSRMRRPCEAERLARVVWAAGVARTHDAYANVLEAHVRTQRADDATRWLGEMQAHGFDADEGALRQLIYVQHAAGDARAAVATYRYAVRLGYFNHWSVISAGAMDLHWFTVPMAIAAVTVVLEDMRRAWQSGGGGGGGSGSSNEAQSAVNGAASTGGGSSTAAQGQDDVAIASGDAASDPDSGGGTSAAAAAEHWVHDPRLELQIITGHCLGRGSRSRLQPALIEMLNALGVEAFVLVRNRGVLVVYHGSLLEYAAKAPSGGDVE